MKLIKTKTPFETEICYRNRLWVGNKNQMSNKIISIISSIYRLINKFEYLYFSYILLIKLYI